MDVGKLLRDKRIEKGLTQRDIAEKVGVSEGTVSRWESGKIENMRRDKIQALSEILSIDPVALTRSDDKAMAPLAAAGIGAFAGGMGALAASKMGIMSAVNPLGAAIAGVFAAVGTLSNAVSDEKSADVGVMVLHDTTERRMVEAFRNLSDADKAVILSMLHSLAEKNAGAQKEAAPE